MVTVTPQNFVCQCVAGERPGGREFTAHDTHYGGHPSSGVSCTFLRCWCSRACSLDVTCFESCRPIPLKEYHTTSPMEGECNSGNECRHESGEYYAIDVGGTNLRVLYARLGQEPKSVVSR